ncbi:hypothetical protein LZC95_20070 [Pendulispora brunnea]|uniref:PEGA domain-containing protein n=1 Tax=Pendulispora brunnea TaxID=2905690 RepID=A0ABZ2KKB1_9BACT
MSWRRGLALELILACHGQNAVGCDSSGRDGLSPTRLSSNPTSIAMRPLYFSLALATATFAMSSRAQAEVDCDANQIKAANARNDEASKHYNANPPRYDAALVSLNQAYGACPRAKLLRNIVVVEIKLGANNPKSMVSAARHAHQMAAEDQAWMDGPGNLAKYQEWLKAARESLGGIIVRAPQGARILVDGLQLPAGYGPDDLVEVELGRHVVAVDVYGKRTEKPVDVPTKTVAVEVNFNDASDKPVAETAKPETPPRPTEPIAPPPPKPESGGLPCFHSGGCVGTTVALGVIALGGVAGGFLFDQKVKSAGDDAQAIVNREGGCNGRTSQGCNDIKKHEDDADSAKTLRNVFYIGAGVSAAAAVGVLFLWPKPKSEKAGSAQIVPILTPNTAGVGMSGRF